MAMLHRLGRNGDGIAHDPGGGEIMDENGDGGALHGEIYNAVLLLIVAII